MGSKVQIPAIVYILLVFAASTSIAGPASSTFDIGKYGAKGDGKSDISKALTSAWKEACKFKGASKIVIPKGTYMLNSVTLEGPCSGSVNLVVKGTVKAPANPSAIKADYWVTIRRLDKFTMNGGGVFDGQGQQAWKQNNCANNANCKQSLINLRFDFVTNSLVQGITSLNSKNFHVNIIGCKNLSFQQFTISAPSESLNTDGIHIGRSNGVYITDSKIATGDDCISVGDGTQQLHITGVTCGPGHGISVGSLGRYQNEEPVSGIFVKNCTLTETENGLRIKTWPNMYGGTVTDLHYEDVTMKNVGNPILIDQGYCPYNQCKKGSSSKVKISRVSFKNIRGTSKTKVAVQLSCSSGIPCENVELSNIDLKFTGGGPAVSEASNVKPKISGTFKPAFTKA